MWNPTWLPRNEYCYSTALHSRLCMAEIHPPLIRFDKQQTPIYSLEELMAERDVILYYLECNLLRAERENSKRRNILNSNTTRSNQWPRDLFKSQQLDVLDPQVVQLIQAVVYKLNLLHSSEFHPSFHVSQLKPSHMWGGLCTHNFIQF